VSGYGGSTTTGGVSGYGGSTTTGGVSGYGGSTTTGGVSGYGGSTTVCIPTITTLEVNSNVANVCTDGIDNDCNGTVDCPDINIRFPPPGQASAGDDAMVRLNPPNSALALQRIECRTDKTPNISAKPWTPCDVTNPTNPTLYAMGEAAAKLDATNGVEQFEFRYVYGNGTLSDTRAMAFYSHNSLYDGVPRTPKFKCEPAAPDDAYFSYASSVFGTSTTQNLFAAGDIQLRNPFIYVKFTPKFVGDFKATTDAQEIKLFSLRHRFVLSPDRQLLLVVRQYSSRRSGPVFGGSASCLAGAIMVHDRYHLGVKDPNRNFTNQCDAIVLNKSGAGLCLAGNGGTPKLVAEHTSKILGFLQGLGIAWPRSDPMMWQKFFVDDRPKRKTLRFFSDKCLPSDSGCLSNHPSALILPDQGHAYFNLP
jgi:hypothetical protein